MAYAKVSGIYRIECSGNGKHYIGSAISLKQRLACHRSMLRKGIHANKHLQNAWNKYGSDSFLMIVIEECKVESLIEREQYWIDFTQAANPEIGMNNSPTASTTIGFRHSETTKEKLSDIAKQRDHTHLRELAESQRGKPSLSRGSTGIPWTAEQKAKASAKRKGRTPWNVGIPMAKEVKARVSKSVSKNRRVISEVVRNEVKSLRSKGFSYPKIAGITGISVAQSYRIVQECA